MTRTLLLLFHPDLERSSTNSALLAAARTVEGVDPVDMYRLYPDGRLDIDTDSAREAERLLRADRIVLQFPVHWYSTPPLLKTWQDVVLTRMYYREYQQEGSRLEGTPVMIAATAGTIPEGCGPASRNYYSLEECLKPLRATAHRCGLEWRDPFLVFRAGRLSAPELSAIGERYADRLRDWIAAEYRAVSGRSVNA